MQDRMTLPRPYVRTAPRVNLILGHYGQLVNGSQAPAINNPLAPVPSSQSQSQLRYLPIPSRHGIQR